MKLTDFYLRCFVPACMWVLAVPVIAVGLVVEAVVCVVQSISYKVYKAN